MGDINTLMTIFLYGATFGGILALISSGFTLIFGVSRILNFSHGAFFMMGAYIGIYLIQQLNLDPLIASLISILLVGIFAVATYITIIHPVIKNEVMTIIVTLALALLVEQVILLTFGEFGFSYPELITGTISVGGVAISLLRILILAISLATILALWLFIDKTRMGKEINAASQDPEGAILIGLDVNKIFAVTIFISAILAALSGILYSQMYTANPFQILNSLILAFSIVILGGLGSVKGSIISSFIIGFIYIATTTLLGARWSEFIALAIIIVILIIRPTGLFGVEE